MLALSLPKTYLLQHLSNSATCSQSHSSVPTASSVVYTSACQPRLRDSKRNRNAPKSLNFTLNSGGGGPSGRPRRCCCLLSTGPWIFLLNFPPPSSSPSSPFSTTLFIMSQVSVRLVTNLNDTQGIPADTPCPSHRHLAGEISTNTSSKSS